MDKLTGLPGAAELVAELEALMVGEEMQPVSLASVDLDSFKHVNDAYGHDVGDQMLIAFAELLRKTVGVGQPYRYSGDEFIVLFQGVEKETAFLVMEQVRRGFAGIRPPALADDENCTVSIGVAAMPDDTLRVQELISKADGAMYRAKVTGRNRICLAKDEKMVTKTSHYTQEQLQRLSLLAKKEGLGEAVLLREALSDLLLKYNE